MVLGDLKLSQVGQFSSFFSKSVKSIFSMEEVMMISTPESEEDVRAAWKTVVTAKNNETSDEFSQCMEPYEPDCFLCYKYL